jgi:hypothetical protein
MPLDVPFPAFEDEVQALKIDETAISGREISKYFED